MRTIEVRARDYYFFTVCLLAFCHLLLCTAGGLGAAALAGAKQAAALSGGPPADSGRFATARRLAQPDVGVKCQGENRKE